jgi:hypothetical protein
MSSAKSSLMDEINAKIAKRKLKKEAASDNKTYRSAVFDFFKNIEEAKQLSKNSRYDADIGSSALISLNERLRVFDPGCRVNVVWRDSDNISGVTITWSNAFAAKHNVDKETHIDVSEMLLF